MEEADALPRMEHN